MMPMATAISGAGARGSIVLHRHKYRDHDDRDRQSDHRRFRDAFCQRNQVAKEKWSFVKVDAQELRNLIHDDDNPDPCLEPDQHGFGDEVGDKAQAQKSRQYKNASHQQR